MRRIYLYSLLVLLALVSCKKEKGLAGGSISLIAEEGPTTKGLLSDATLKTSGNRIQVVDVLSDFTGSASWMSGNKYIEEEIVYSGSRIWGYNSGRIYPWTTDGTHQFFGWLSFDTSLRSGSGLTADAFFFPNNDGTVISGFSSVERTLTLPAREINTESPQYDFLYGNTINYVMPRSSTDPVPLMLQHLFSAISILLRNESGDQIIINSVTVEGLKNKKSAVVTFVGSPVTSVVGGASGEFVNNTLFSALPVATRTLDDGDSYDLLARVEDPDTPGYRIIWPQSASDLAPADPEDFSTYPITVQFAYASEPAVYHTVHLRFPEGATLDAGTRYVFTLIFTQKHVRIASTVNPWNYERIEWSYTEQSISEVKELDFKDNDGYDKPNKVCYVVGGTPVKGTFSIKNPSGAIWSIEPVGDVKYFTITPNQGTIDSDDSDYEFEVIPNLDPSLDRSTDKKLKFRFYVRFADGTSHDANSEINRDNWTVILPKI